MDVQTPLWFLLILAIAPALVTALAMYYSNKLSSDARSRDLKAQLEQERLLRTKEWGKEYRTQLVQQINAALTPLIMAGMRWQAGETNELEMPRLDILDAVARAWFSYDPAITDSYTAVFNSIEKYHEAIESEKGKALTPKTAAAERELIYALRQLGQAEEHFIAGYTRVG